MKYWTLQSKQEAELFRKCTRRFAKSMQDELHMNTHKRGWKSLTPLRCVSRAEQELKELRRAIKSKKSNKEIISECADVGNFMMMIQDNLCQPKDKCE